MKKLLILLSIPLLALLFASQGYAKTKKPSKALDKAANLAQCKKECGWDQCGMDKTKTLVKNCRKWCREAKKDKDAAEARERCLQAARAVKKKEFKPGLPPLRPIKDCGNTNLINKYLGGRRLIQISCEVTGLSKKKSKTLVCRYPKSQLEVLGAGKPHLDDKSFNFVEFSRKVGTEKGTRYKPKKGDIITGLVDPQGKGSKSKGKGIVRCVKPRPPAFKPKGPPRPPALKPGKAEVRVTVTPEKAKAIELEKRKLEPKKAIKVSPEKFKPGAKPQRVPPIESAMPEVKPQPVPKPEELQKPRVGIMPAFNFPSDCKRRAVLAEFFPIKGIYVLDDEEDPLFMYKLSENEHIKLGAKTANPDLRGIEFHPNVGTIKGTKSDLAKIRTGRKFLAFATNEPKASDSRVVCLGNLQKG